jgi:hypothetical protein
MTDTLQVVYLVAILLLVLPTLFYVFRQNNALRNLAIWLALFAALGWGYHLLVERPALESNAPPAEEASDSPVRNL